MEEGRYPLTVNVSSRWHGAGLLAAAAPTVLLMLLWTLFLCFSGRSNHATSWMTWEGGYNIVLVSM